MSPGTSPRFPGPGPCDPGDPVPDADPWLHKIQNYYHSGGLIRNKLLNVYMRGHVIERDQKLLVKRLEKI